MSDGIHASAVRMAVALVAFSLLFACSKNQPPEADSDQQLEYVGIVTDVSGDDIPTGFRLCLSGQVTLSVSLRSADEYDFDLGHLRDHQRTQEPIRVLASHTSEGIAVAKWIVDSEAGPSECLG